MAVKEVQDSESVKTFTENVNKIIRTPERSTNGTTDLSALSPSVFYHGKLLDSEGILPGALKSL